MIKPIYFDNNATTQIDDKILNAMLPYLQDNFGNPSSIYAFGKNIKEKIENSRTIIAKYFNCDKDEIIFTSGASESNTTAIMSAVRNNPNKKHIITTKVEHASILENMKYLESIGYNITYLSVNQYGQIDLNELKSSITSDTFLISIMLANNEIGNIYPIEEISRIAIQNNILLHVDAVQAIGKMNIDVKKLNVNTLSVSGHKIHAPKGIGILYVKNTTPFTPLIFGHQENNRRGGTENVPYIIGIGKAFELISNNSEELIQIQQLRDKLENELKNSINNIEIFGDTINRLPNTTNILFEGIKGEELLIMLEQNNIFVSTGSACNSFDIEPSHVLKAINVDFSHGSPIRISLSKHTTENEIDILVKKLINIVNMLRKRG